MPRPGSACSSYLLQTGGAMVVLDLGPGATAKLQLAVDYTAIDAIVISHVHPDHYFDLVPLRYGLKYGATPRKRRVPLWLPPGGRKVLAAMSELIEGAGGPDFFEGVFSIGEYAPADALVVCDLRLTFRRTRHYIDAFAIRAEHDGVAITYSADTAPSEAVVEHARSSAILLCEAALGLKAEEGERGHSSAAEAGAMAARAGVERLVLTHYPASYEAEALIAAAKQNFSGPVELAVDGAEFLLSS
jgi:ribonuclease BN (tRNA processing enzyme)